MTFKVYQKGVPTDPRVIEIKIDTPKNTIEFELWSSGYGQGGVDVPAQFIYLTDKATAQIKKTKKSSLLFGTQYQGRIVQQYPVAYSISRIFSGSKSYALVIWKEGVISKGLLELGPVKLALVQVPPAILPPRQKD